MPSSYTPLLRLTLPADGELVGTWGQTVNNGITSLEEAAIAGTANVALVDADYVMTIANGAADVARNAVVRFTGALSAQRNIIVPSSSKTYFIRNATSGGFNLLVKTAAGTGVAVPPGGATLVYCDGVNVLDAINALGSTLYVSGTFRADGGIDGAPDLILKSSGTEKMRINAAGNIGIGVTPTAGQTIRISKNITGAVTAYVVVSNGAIQPDVTASAVGYHSSITTAAAAFTLPSVTHFNVSPLAPGAGSTLTSQFGFYVGAGMTGATNNHGFRGDLAAAAGRYNLYMGGNADNYIAGNVGIGVAPNTWNVTFKTLQVNCAALYATTGNAAVLAANTYNDGASKYIAAGAASNYAQIGGVHSWSNAPVGAANAAATFTERMRINEAGNVGIGTISNGPRLAISGANGSAGVYIEKDGATAVAFLGAHSVYFGGASNDALLASYTTNLTFATASVERMRIDTVGNVGVNVAPAPWWGGRRGIQLGGSGNLADASLMVSPGTQNFVALSSNVYIDTGVAARYVGNGAATQYAHGDGAHTWGTAVAGAAGALCALTERMRLDVDGNLLVGASSGSEHTFSKNIGEGGVLAKVNSTFTGKNCLILFSTNGANAGGSGSAAQFGTHSGTSRSINCGGTVNTSGADYAEYEHNNGLVIPKGAIVGFKADGTLTQTFAEAIRFGIKSTNPSYVGGDSWGVGLEGVALEAARQNVDRAAYSGKVPVNVFGALPGGYIVAEADADGDITGVFVADVDFAQYKRAVGRVNRILEDGRAEVAVIVH